MLQYSFGIVKKILLHIITNVPAYLIGVLSVFSICKLTHVCTKLSQFHSLMDFEEVISSLATPDRLTRAAEFVQTAITKFSEHGEVAFENLLQ